MANATARLSRSLGLITVGILIGAVSVYLLVTYTSGFVHKRSSPSNTAYSDHDLSDPNQNQAESYSQFAVNGSLIQTEDLDCRFDENTSSDKTTPRLLHNLDNSRSILANDLSRLSHWGSMQEFEESLLSFLISNDSNHHLLAKGRVYFQTDYVAALVELYSAQQSASDDERLEMFQHEISALIDYVRRQYFSENQMISINTFTQLMNLANEKQPNNIPVIVSLVRHHLLLGDYHLAENFIERIPSDLDNLSTIKLLNHRLEENIASNPSQQNGIPLIKSGDHYIVEAVFNNDVTVRLMLDTGASSTAVSRQTMSALMTMSDGFNNIEFSKWVSTAGGPVRARLFRGESLSVDDFEMDNPLILETAIAKNNHFDGVIGMDFLSKYEFRIDHKTDRLYLSH
ncbi:MAG: retroviral-like aspartic protease family protein [Kangiellaceae bacterium]|nr:retroviral-like aspartic protease family protein [Kangiellaceae bacterium]